MIRPLLALAAFGMTAAVCPAQDGPGSDRAESLAADLRREGVHVDVRRDAAKAIVAAGRDVQRATLPALIDAMMNEEDGQVRLAVLDAVTALGPDAEPAIPALVHTLRTDSGGRRREQTHQDYRSALALAAVGAPAVEALQGLLDEDRESVRAEAVMALGRIGPDAGAAVPSLVPLLGDESDRIRDEAVIALGRIGPDAVGPLIEAATLGDEAVRPKAVEALGHSIEPGDRVRLAVLDRVRDPAPGVRAAAVSAMGRLGVPDDDLAAVLGEAIRDEDEGARLAAVNLLVDRQEMLRGLVPTLRGLLTADDEGVARHAAFLIHLIGPETAPLLLDALRREGGRVDPIAEALAQIGRPIQDLLTEAVADPDPRVRSGAALALGRIRPLAPGTGPLLTAGLRDTDPGARSAFLAAIGELGPRGREAVPAVRDMLRDESPESRLQALGILVRSAPRDNLLVDDLVGAIDDDDARVQRSAIEALSSLGPLGRDALPAVIATLEGPHPEVRLAAAELIASHGPAAAEAVPALVAMLGDPEPSFREVAARTLGGLGPASGPAFDRLAPLLDDAHAGVREAAALALASSGRDAEALRPLLSKALRDDDPDVRGAVRRAVGRLGPPGAILLPDLIRSAAMGEDRQSVERSLRRLERTGPDERSIPELIELLGHEHEAVRLLAARFLGLAGPAAVGAIPALEQLGDDPSAEVREQAEAARARIEGDVGSAPGPM